MKIFVTAGYAFQPAATPPTLDVSACVDATGAPLAITPQNLVGVLNLSHPGVSGIVFAPKPSYGAHWTGSVLALQAPTQGMLSTDQLLLVVEDGTIGARDATLSAFAQTAHGDAVAALGVLETLATTVNVQAVTDKLEQVRVLAASTLSAIQQQADLAVLFVTDGTLFYVRREVQNEDSLTTSIVFENMDGSVANPQPNPANLKPATVKSRISTTGYFDALNSGTGYTAGDILAHVVITDMGDQSVVAIWQNLTVGATIAAPAAGDIKEQSRDIAVTKSVLPDGAAAAAQLPGSIGQKAASASLAVVVAPDQSVIPVSGATPVGQAPVNSPVSVAGMDGGGLKRHILTDATGAVQIVPRSNVASVVAAGTVQNVGDAITVPCDGMNTAVIKLSALSGSPTGAGVFEVSFGDADWFAVNAIPYGGGAPVTGASPSTTAQAFEFAEGGVSAFRFRVTTAFSAPQPVRGIASNGLKSIRVGNTAQQPLNVAGTFSASFSALAYWHEVVAKQGSANIVGTSRASGAAQGQASQWGFFEAIVESSVDGRLTLVNEDQPSFNIVRTVKAGVIDREVIRAFGSSFHAEFLPNSSGAVSLSNGFVK